MRRSNTSGIAISAQLTRPSRLTGVTTKLDKKGGFGRPFCPFFHSRHVVLIRNRPKQMVMGAMELVQKARPATIETLDQRHDG